MKWKEKIFTKANIILLILLLAGFLYKAYPHILFAQSWLPTEEEYNYMTVNDILYNSNRRVDFYPMLEHYSVVAFSMLTTINPEVVAQYTNAFFGTLTIIPIYLISRKYLSKEYSIYMCLLWTFSEAVFYRVAHFGTTEPMSLFLVMCSLYFFTTEYNFFINKKYEMIKYIPAFLTLGLAFYAHLLPALFLIGMFVVYYLLYGSWKQRISFLSIIVGVILFLYSPLNPHQRIITLITPEAIANNFDLANLFLYSGPDLFMGISIFFGLVILACLSLISILYLKEREPLFMSMLVTAGLLFIFSWVAYSQYLFAPPRLTVYFVVPLSYFALIAIRRTIGYDVPIRWFAIGMICVAMITSAISGLEPMLWVNDSLTNKEYEAIFYLRDNNLIGYPSHWLCDYGVRVALTANSNISLYQTVVLNTTVSLDYAKDIGEGFAPSTKPTKPTNQTDPTASPTPTPTPPPPENNTTPLVFKHVFISERMKERAFLVQYTENRTVHTRVPVYDIWANSTFWEVIYTNEEVVIYERIGG